MKTYELGTDPNHLEIAVSNVEINPQVIMKNGIMNPFVVVKINKYNLEDLLSQMLNDYGKDKIIDKINSL